MSVPGMSLIAIEQYWAVKYKALIDKFKQKCVEFTTLETINVELKAQLVKYMTNCNNCTKCDVAFDRLSLEGLEQLARGELPQQEDDSSMSELSFANSNDLAEAIQVDPDISAYQNDDRSGTDFESEEDGVHASDTHCDGILTYRIDEKGFFKCTIANCGKLYRDKTKLRIHYDENHRKIRWPCPFCDLLFTRKAAVKRHSDKRHVKQPLDLEALVAIAINTKEGQLKLQEFRKSISNKSKASKLVTAKNKLLKLKTKPASVVIPSSKSIKRGRPSVRPAGKSRPTSVE